MSQPTFPGCWWTERQLADRYQVTVSVIRQWQRDGAGPVFVTRAGKRVVAEDVIARWEASLQAKPDRPTRSAPADPETCSCQSCSNRRTVLRSFEGKAPRGSTPVSEPTTGWIYIIGSTQLSGVVKIGFSGDHSARLRCLQIGSPVPLVLLWSVPGTSAHEPALHRHFASLRIHGEHFDFGDADPVAEVERVWRAWQVMIPPTNTSITSAPPAAGKSGSTAP